MARFPEPQMPALPPAFVVMLRGRGAAGYVVVGRCALDAMPERGKVLAVTVEGRAIQGTIDALFVPPECEEHCVGTVFLSEA